MSTLRALPNYLKMHRKRSGFTQREVAFLLGAKDRAKISRYERGERIPSLTTLIGFEVVFRASTHKLFAGTYERTAGEVRGRASRLHKELDALPLTGEVKQKLEALVEVLYPNLPRKAA